MNDICWGVGALVIFTCTGFGAYHFGLLVYEGIKAKEAEKEHVHTSVPLYQDK